VIGYASASPDRLREGVRLLAGVLADTDTISAPQS
jgi:hypothetical protein